MKKLIFIFCLFVCFVSTNYAQADTISLKNKLEFASELLKTQTSPELLQLTNYGNFRLDSIVDNAYYFKNIKNNVLIVYFDTATKKILSISFNEKSKYRNELYAYLTKTEKYEYFASEHMCDYMNKKGINIGICPIENKLEFSISLFYR